MKNKDIIKICIVGFFLVFLLILLILFSFLKIFVPKKEKTIEKSIITQTYSLENIEKTSFNFKKSNSTFVVGDSDELVIVQNSMEEKFYLNSKQKGNELSFVEDSYIINPQKKKYIIYFPKKYINRIAITNGFGELSITGIYNDVDINNNSGKLSLDTVENISIKDVSGDIQMKNVQGIVNISTSTGDISAENIVGIVNAESITGDISIVGFNTLGESYFENVSGDIILQMIPDSICKINYSNDTGKTLISDSACVGEFNMITVKNITGMIKIN